jgi:hypothetical protein
MTAEVSRLPGRNEAPMSRARRLRDEARDTVLEVAELLSGEVATLASRCAELSEIDTLPAGMRDAFRKLAMELESRNQSLAQIMGGSR